MGFNLSTPIGLPQGCLIAEGQIDQTGLMLETRQQAVLAALDAILPACYLCIDGSDFPELCRTRLMELAARMVENPKLCEHIEDIPTLGPCLKYPYVKADNQRLLDMKDCGIINNNQLLIVPDPELFVVDTGA